MSRAILFLCCLAGLAHTVRADDEDDLKDKSRARREAISTAKKKAAAVSTANNKLDRAESDLATAKRRVTEARNAAKPESCHEPCVPSEWDSPTWNDLAYSGNGVAKEFVKKIKADGVDVKKLHEEYVKKLGTNLCVQIIENPNAVSGLKGAASACAEFKEAWDNLQTAKGNLETAKDRVSRAEEASELADERKDAAKSDYSEALRDMRESDCEECGMGGMGMYGGAYGMMGGGMYGRPKTNGYDLALGLTNIIAGAGLGAYGIYQQGRGARLYARSYAGALDQCRTIAIPCGLPSPYPFMGGGGGYGFGGWGGGGFGGFGMMGGGGFGVMGGGGMGLFASGAGSIFAGGGGGYGMPGFYGGGFGPMYGGFGPMYGGFGPMYGGGFSPWGGGGGMGLFASGAGSIFAGGGGGYGMPGFYGGFGPAYGGGYGMPGYYGGGFGPMYGGGFSPWGGGGMGLFASGAGSIFAGGGMGMMGGYPPGYWGGGGFDAGFPGMMGGMMGMAGGMGFQSGWYQAMMQASMQYQQTYMQQQMQAQQNIMAAQMGLYDAQQRYYQTVIQSTSFGGMAGTVLGGQMGAAPAIPGPAPR